jgi:3-methyl-2-oxobutanoate hydroxymethyltransferase
LDELLYHCRSVARGCHSSLLVSDMPFGSFIASTSEGVNNAVRIIQEGNMDAVKIEGGEEVAELIKRLTAVGIPVMGHVGLKPQRQAASSGFRVQGRTKETAVRVYREAKAIEAAGAFSIVLEAVPAKLATFISSKLSIPTIGIGAGAGCDGQVLVQLDMLGVSSLSKGPKFLKKYETWEQKATSAIAEYVTDVRSKSFPEEQHTYKIKDDIWEEFLDEIKSDV